MVSRLQSELFCVIIFLNFMVTFGTLSHLYFLDKNKTIIQRSLWFLLRHLSCRPSSGILSCCPSSRHPVLPSFLWTSFVFILVLGTLSQSCCLKTAVPSRPLLSVLVLLHFTVTHSHRQPPFLSHTQCLRLRVFD